MTLFITGPVTFAYRLLRLAWVSLTGSPSANRAYTALHGPDGNNGSSSNPSVNSHVRQT
ncbi:hypothetical protein M378DRAFT_160738 [Amanita muscaria Koide BX008]|uniref:Uncharacterized protein n=1 Tax=Amanita muscaria (strain Koide BX008) TaxID=946122 RepID=A0A0C2STK5_AMAMK|nr:hypothetical protein M378DRAFT_160738 [Amanita muscaria Koide BX008]